ncbi:MAG: glycerophosphodiester phosphodiesterase [Alistipes sp.]|nr:glycerophosphodiester phosphodiesterase [Alistipes sp.]
MKRILTLVIAISVVAIGLAQPKIVAHRGYHQKGGAPANSIEALQMAQEYGFDMVEFDVNMSADGKLLILHGEWHPNYKAEPRAHALWDKAEKIQSLLLPNGEKVPTFEEWIAQSTKSDRTDLLIEIKGNITPAKDTEMVKKILAVLKKYKMERRTIFLVNHEFLVKELVRLAPKGTLIAYSLPTYCPTYCHALGCKIAGRSYVSWQRDPRYLKEARELGMKLMAWTPNNPKDIEWLIEQGFDYILTDEPMMMREILNTHKK